MYAGRGAARERASESVWANRSLCVFVQAVKRKAWMAVCTLCVLFGRKGLRYLIGLSELSACSRSVENA